MNSIDRPDVARLRGLLETMEGAWREEDAPIVPLLRPGLTDEQIDDLCQPLGLAVPLELRVWWNWHDGADLPSNGNGAHRAINSWSEFLPLASALELCQRKRQWFPVDGDEPYWKESWLPFSHAGGPDTLFVDCARIVHPDTAPVRVQDHDWQRVEVDAANSLTHAVALWSWVAQSGIRRWDSEADLPHWELDWDAVPLFIQWTGLL